MFNKKKTWYFLFDFTGGKSQFAGGGSSTLKFLPASILATLLKCIKSCFVCVEELEVK
jgi:hypothetical protein